MINFSILFFRWIGIGRQVENECEYSSQNHCDMCPCTMILVSLTFYLFVHVSLIGAPGLGRGRHSLRVGYIYVHYMYIHIRVHQMQMHIANLGFYCGS